MLWHTLGRRAISQEQGCITLETHSESARNRIKTNVDLMNEVRWLTRACLCPVVDIIQPSVEFFVALESEVISFVFGL